MSANMKPNHVMIDLETMGLVPGCAIVSIGAVVFEPRGNIITKNTFYRELDWQAQPFDVNEDTLAWWAKQPDEVRGALNGLDDLYESLMDLSSWLPADCKVWGNGPTFDISILEHCYRYYDATIPWKFWNVRDCRTINDMYESARGGLGGARTGFAHNALDDSIHQAKNVNKMWKSLLGGDK